LYGAGDKYEEHEEVCAHVDTRPEQFIEWTIEYRDGNGDKRLFIFDNRDSLSRQIQRYVTKYIPAYYEENFLKPFMEDVPLAPSSYVFGFFAKISVNRFVDKDVEECAQKADAWLEGLNSPEGTICLSRLTPANVFELCPVYLAVNVSPGDSYSEDITDKIERMIDAMNQYANNYLTASIHNGSRWWSYVQGKQIFDSDAAGLYFERFAFDGYRGVFW